MPMMWVTGNSGSGKSAVCEALQASGHAAFDSDEDGVSRWVSRTDGAVVEHPPYPVPAGWLDSYGWRIDRARVAALARQHPGDTVYLCGSAENEFEVRDLFDEIICLVVDDATLRTRLATRTTNAFGQNPEELQAALEWNPRMETSYRHLGATLIDATAPLHRVVAQVLAVRTAHQ